jgi:hypothetical protein
MTVALRHVCADAAGRKPQSAGGLVASGGDLNGDGLADVLIGLPGSSQIYAVVAQEGFVPPALPLVVRCDSGCDGRRAGAPAANTAVGWELLGLVAALPIADEAQRDGAAAIPEARREPIALSWLRRLSDVGTVEQSAPTERSTP